MRTDVCAICGTTFVVFPRHPAIESDWCPTCWQTVLDRLLDRMFGPVEVVPAMKTEDV